MAVMWVVDEVVSAGGTGVVLRNVIEPDML
jgi:hypothetical protein